ncbi:MAG: CsgG/HfaB family protein [Candidatus Omnitrophota bacterium]
MRKVLSHLSFVIAVLFFLSDGACIAEAQLTVFSQSGRSTLKKRPRAHQAPRNVPAPQEIPFKIPYDPHLPTKRILISPFQNGVPSLDTHMNAEIGLTAQLTTALSKCKNFIVLDRDAIEILKDELTLSQSGAVTQETSAKAGKLLGSQVIVKGVVTEFSEEAQGRSSGTKVNAGQLAGAIGVFSDSKGVDFVEALNPEIGQGNETVSGVVGIDIKLLDVNTGKVLDTFTARGEITRANSSSALGIGGFSTMSENFEKTVIGQATRAAIQDAVIRIFTSMKRVPWSGLIAVAKNDGTVIINAGMEQNICPGQIMNVVREGETITDPATGLVLYSEENTIGQIRVFDIQEKISIGKVISGGNFQRGDKVILLEESGIQANTAAE